jgi:hypothetical protein
MAVQFGEEPTSEQRALIESAKGRRIPAVIATVVVRSLRSAS